MRTSIRVKTLAAVVVASLGGVVAPAVWSQPSVGDGAAPAAAVSQYAIYMIYFGEPGALEYRGGAGTLAATAAATDGGARFDANSDAVRAYRQYLEQRQAEYIQGIRVSLGRDVEVPHTYQITHSGISAKLTEAEAAAVSALPGVSHVERERLYNVDTFRGPSFIGAQTAWGAAVPTPATAVNFGKGIVIGVIDSGVNAAHPSFANDARCGFSATDPKMLSTRDCSTNAAGVCNGPNGLTDATGHGSHTASTSGGNVVGSTAVPPPVIPAPFTQISGVAPCASLRTYRVCETDTCSGSALTAAFQNVLLDGDIDVINYSISGGSSPWSDGDRTFLDFVNAGIFVSASAGNTRAETPNPIGNVNHLGPWVMSVASSTHDENPSGGTISAAGPGTPPANTQNIALNVAGVNVGTGGTYPIRINTANDIGCTATGGFPAGFFTGAIALIPRGTCSFEEKLINAGAAGAVAGIVYNNAAGALNMAIGAATVPSYSILQADGLALRAFITANGATPTTASFTPAEKIGDLLSSFSLRGPSRPITADITKPDITGPGDNIYAAYKTPENYAFVGGTSMSSPHIAGSGALVRAARPSWSPMAVKSALQLTAKPDGVKEDGVSPWHPDDVGNGRVQVDRAIAAGLVMEETVTRFLAANPSGGSINMKELNIPSMRNTNCVPNCTFTRTFTSKLAASSTWNVTSESDYGVTVVANPASFTISAGGTQAVTFTVSLDASGPDTQLPNTPAFAYAVLTPSVASVSPVERLTVAVRGTRPVNDLIFRDGFDPEEVVDPNIVVFNNVNFVPQANFTGGAIQWIDATTCQCDTTPYNFNVYSNTAGTALQFFFPVNTPVSTNGAVGTATAYSVLSSGTVVGPSSTFLAITAETATANWKPGTNVDGYLGYRFYNTATSQVNYGYARITTVAPNGRPFTIVSTAYNNTGAPITIP